MLELTMNADYCVNFESLSERMQIRLAGADFPDKKFMQLMYNFIRSVTMKKFPSPLEKGVGHSLKLFDLVKKFEPLSENSSPHLVSQAGYGPELHTFVSFNLFILLSSMLVASSNACIALPPSHQSRHQKLLGSKYEKSGPSAP